MVGMHGSQDAEMALLLCITPVVFMATVTDLRTFKIPNILPLAGLVIFAVTCMIFLPLSEIPYRLLGGLIVFVVCFVLFIIGAMGGGDAKLLPVIALFVPTHDSLVMVTALASSGVACLALTAVIMIMRRMSWSLESSMWGEVSDWGIWTSGRHVPYALAMASALALYLSFRLHL